MSTHSPLSVFLPLLLLATGMAAADAGAQSTGGEFAVVREVIASGGEPAAGDFRAVVTAGQPVAGSQSGGDFVLSGGFHVAAEAAALPDPIFNDGFESP